ncbi:wax alcohol acyltransferase 2 [Seminavis robusta]|uniref:Acyltransferase n=1 Tax=Seminavis robusta TaxID=568900 RepID=A0A9N8H8A7_9STRA|nr:wax alcohol acyltransferase 2 [Seminavis robusta]|eukprot:Sro154_g070190.1 wax alcohol acyltransferase 2 (364) ;mRNA; r:88185-89360
MPQVPCSLYPSPSKPPHVLLQVPGDPWTWQKQAILTGSSLVLIGSLAWVPACYVWAYKRWKAVKDKRRKALYGALMFALTALFVAGPQRRPWFGKHIGFNKWKIWHLWCQFMALEVWKDSRAQLAASAAHEEYKSAQSITAIVPHGIFPFSIGLAGIPEVAEKAFGRVRIAIATATNLFPVVRDIVSIVNTVDVSRTAVHEALTDGARLALLPGGIPEMFEGYPRQLTHPDDEFAIIPNGFVRMAIQHKIPLMPVYCFGATKWFKRVRLPEWLEALSLKLRIGICIFYGASGLPIPFRQKAFYIMGDAIQLPAEIQQSPIDASQEEVMTKELHQQFCEELMRMFENNKEVYGWGHKVLHLVTR